jgi:hypothetical protein
VCQQYERLVKIRSLTSLIMKKQPAGGATDQECLEPMGDAVAHLFSIRMQQIDCRPGGLVVTSQCDVEAVVAKNRLLTSNSQ